MKRYMLALVMVSSLGRIAFADDPEPLYKCHAASESTKLSASFGPDVSLKDLSAWVIGFSCKNIIFSADVAKHATRLNIISPNKMSPKQAIQLFVDAVESTGLVVVQKNDSIIIKLGAGMPKGCPDVASVDAPSTTTPPSVEDHDLEAELDAGIKVVDETHRTIMRALVDKVLSNPMGVAKGARIVPSVKDGKPNGFKLYAIRPSSIYAKLGFANGDTLLSINGFELTSADKALEVYTKLRDATSLEIELQRRGKSVTLFFTIK